ncbi:MAG: aspartate--tRNA(Asn) ligase [Patescibacteria group bacterium]
MERTLIKDAAGKLGEKATLSGFVETARIQSKLIFLILRDISGSIQCVIGKESPAFPSAQNLSLESVVSVTGSVVAAAQAPGGYEIQVESIEVLSTAEPELPIPVVIKAGEDTEAPTRFDYRWLDLRKPGKSKIFRVWTELERGFRKYWLDNGYTQIYTPSFMQTPSESGADVFEVNYFDRKAYLAQSPQFYKQMAMASGLEKVFMTGPVFRAELSFTTRHMTEFTGWDFEVSFIKSHEDPIREEEGMIVEGFRAVASAMPELNLEIPTRPFPKITMAEAKKVLKDKDIPSPDEYDLSPEEERIIGEWAKETHNHDFVFVTEYHKSKSAFYHMRLKEGSDFSRRADLLYKGLEVTTLAQREHRVEILERQAKEKGMDTESLKDYLNFFRFGCPPHGGGGIGPGRIIMRILDLPNVREATYLPRDVKRLNP